MKFLAVVACAVLAGCTTTTSNSNDKPIADYPEGQAYMRCLVSTAKAYARQQGGPYELGVATYAHCAPERFSLEKALRKENSRAFVDGFMRADRRTGAEDAAGMIAEIRRRY